MVDSSYSEVVAAVLACSFLVELVGLVEDQRIAYWVALEHFQVVGAV